MQLAVLKVVAIAVRIVITMLRILPQVLLLLNVPIVVEFFNGFVRQCLTIWIIELVHQGLVSVANILHKFCALRDRAR